MIHKKLPFKIYKSIYSRVSRLCVEVVVQTNNGIVLTFRDIEPYKGYWHVPGGAVLYKEKLHDAVKRIAKDELGTAVTIERYIGYQEYPLEAKVRGWGWTVSLIFLTKIKSGMVRGSEQGKKVKMFKILPQKVVPEQKDFLIKYNIFKA